MDEEHVMLAESCRLFYRILVLSMNCILHSALLLQFQTKPLLPFEGVSVFHGNECICTSCMACRLSTGI